MHDYAVPGSVGELTQLRPGLLATPTPTPTPPVPVPVPRDALGGGAGGEFGSWDAASYRSAAGGGWSHPRSAVRSVSGSSGTGVSNRSASDEEEEEAVEEDDGMGEEDGLGGGIMRKWWRFAGAGEAAHRRLGGFVCGVDQDEEMGSRGKETEEEEGWDGIEMEMEMD
jgi:hypothetical protein